MKKFLFLVLSLILVSACFATSEDLSFINDMTISGNVSTNALTFSGSGSVINGNNVKVYIIGPTTNVYINSLTVNGAITPVSFDYYGYFFISNISNFNYSGSLKLLQIGQVNLYITGPVNHLIFSLVDGYTVGGSEFYSLLNKNIIIQRNQASQVLVDADFHYLFERVNNFEYTIRFSSLGNSLSKYTLHLRNNELIQDIIGAVDYAQRGSDLILDLTGSSATVIITGTFSSTNLRIPIDEGVSNVLLESEPEKKLAVSTSATVIDLSDSTITPKYYNSQAFLASSTDVFYVTITDLTLLPSLTFSVSSATNTLALNERGTIIGELKYSYANSGEEYLKISIPGTPLYAATNNRAVMLTKDNNDFLLSIPKTNYGSMVLTYLSTTNPLNLFSILNVPLANTSMPISEMTTNVYLPSNYFVLWTFGSKFGEGTELPDIGSIIVFLVISIALSYTLSKNTGFVIKYIIVIIGLMLLNPALLFLSWVITAVLLIRKYLDKKYYKLVIIILSVLFVLGGILFVLIFLFAGMDSSTVSYAGMGVSTSLGAPSFDNMEQVGRGEGAISLPTETGVLPVNFEIPSMGKTVTLTDELITIEKPVSYSILLMDGNLKYIFTAVSIYLMIKAFFRYKNNVKRKK
ncbi:Uncharacterised protein [Candidatus Tiddalikarchaeum anstoanum]|nr:Uncharacterised protein [Candidatus Tiddalikarchaeum anstoanum]